MAFIGSAIGARQGLFKQQPTRGEAEPMVSRTTAAPSAADIAQALDRRDRARSSIGVRDRLEQLGKLYNRLAGAGERSRAMTDTLLAIRTQGETASRKSDRTNDLLRQSLSVQRKLVDTTVAMKTQLHFDLRDLLIELKKRPAGGPPVGQDNRDRERGRSEGEPENRRRRDTFGHRRRVLSSQNTLRELTGDFGYQGGPLDALGDGIKSLVDAVEGRENKYNTMMREGLKDISGQVTGLFDGSNNSLKEAFYREAIQPWEEGFQRLGAGTKATVDTAIAKVTSVFDDLSAGATSLADTLKSSVSSTLLSIQNSLSEASSWAAEQARGVGNSISSGASSAGSWIAGQAARLNPWGARAPNRPVAVPPPANQPLAPPANGQVGSFEGVMRMMGLREAPGMATGGVLTGSGTGGDTYVVTPKNYRQIAEDGAEAVLPLARGADGKLGVQALGQESSAPVVRGTSVIGVNETKALTVASVDTLIVQASGGQQAGQGTGLGGNGGAGPNNAGGFGGLGGALSNGGGLGGGGFPGNSGPMTGRSQGGEGPNSLRRGTAPGQMGSTTVKSDSGVAPLPGFAGGGTAFGVGGFNSVGTAGPMGSGLAAGGFGLNGAQQQAGGLMGTSTVSQPNRTLGGLPGPMPMPSYGGVMAPGSATPGLGTPGGAFERGGNWNRTARGDDEYAARGAAVVGHYASQGVPTHVAAGIAGNIETESKFNVNASNTVGESSHGMFQWNDANGGNRWQRAREWADRNGRDIADPRTQLDYAKHEASKMPMRDGTGRSVWDAMMQAKTSQEASDIWLNKFEMPKERVQNSVNRGINSRNALDAYNSGRYAPAPTAYGTGNPNSAAPSMAAGVEPKAGAPSLGGASAFGGLQSGPMTEAYANKGEADRAWAAGKGEPASPFQNSASSDRVRERQGQVAGIRTLPIQPGLRDQLQFAAEKAGVEVEVTSGGQAAYGTGGPRTGSTRHDNGGAADLKLYTRDPDTGQRRVLDMRNPEDAARMAEFSRQSVRAGATGIGAGQGYMGNSTLHIGGGKPASWGGAPWIGDSLRGGMSDREQGQKDFAAWQAQRQATIAAGQKPVDNVAASSAKDASIFSGGTAPPDLKSRTLGSQLKAYQKASEQGNAENSAVRKLDSGKDPAEPGVSNGAKDAAAGGGTMSSAGGSTANAKPQSEPSTSVSASQAKTAEEAAKPKSDGGSSQAAPPPPPPPAASSGDAGGSRKDASSGYSAEMKGTPVVHSSMGLMVFNSGLA